EVPAPDPPGRRAHTPLARGVGPPLGRRATRRLRRVQGGHRDAGRHPGPAAAARRDGDDGARRGGQDRDHGRAVRRDEGGDRGLPRVRGRRPRRGARARGPDPRRAHGRCGRGPPGRGVV
ncbi:MAG: hypothetical protein AVDCRST_MAG79-1648, partial [uncultured Thermoleophilia bacterium]